MKRPRSARSTAVASRVYLVAGLLGVAAYAPAGLHLGTAIVFALVGTGVLAVAAGIRLHRPTHRGGWLLILGAAAVWLVGWSFWQGHIASHDGIAPAPDSWQNLLFLGMYPLLLGSLLLLARRREQDPINLLDIAIIATSLAAVAWVFLIHFYLVDETLSMATRTGQILFATGDVLVVAVLARIAASPGRRTPAYWWILGALLAFLFSNLVWNWSTRIGDYVPGSWADTGWLLFPVLLGAAALDPTMASLFEPGTAERRRLRWGRFSLLVAATSVVPVLLAVETLRREDIPANLFVPAVGAGLIGLLVLARMGGVLRETEALALSLAERNRELLELDRLKDDFVASVSHELRTPLTSIRGYLELVREGEAGDLTQQQDEFLSVVGRNADRLLNVVGDLLFAAQLEAETIPLEEGTLDPGALVRHATDAARPVALERGVDLTLELRELPGTMPGDGARLAQALDNLVSNALKFTPEGGRVEVCAASLNGQVEFTVRDTGPGIPPEEQDHLFERFFRARYATDNAVGGTGLGLAITKAIVEAHGGSISVESRDGAGAKFRILIPVERA